MAWFVNGEVVDDAAVRDEARMMRPQYMESIGSMDPIDAEMQLREWARENVIERMLLKAAALADPDPIPADVIAKAIEAVKTEAGGKVGLRYADDGRRREGTGRDAVSDRAPARAGAVRRYAPKSQRDLRVLQAEQRAVCHT